MKGISSKSAGSLINKDKTFQGQKFDDDLGLNWVEFKYRNHDPQIGRFIEIDPLSDKYVYNSTYAFSENKVVRHVELEGLESWDFMKTVFNSAGLNDQTDGPRFVKQTVAKLKEPETYGGAIQMMGPVLGATLIGIATGGVGEGAFLETSINAGVRTEVTTTEVATTETPALIGGRKGDIPTATGIDRHEIPSKQAMKDALGVQTNDVPAVQLPTEIHAQTATFAGGRTAAAARATETALIKSGNIGQAFENGVKNVQTIIQTPQAQAVLKAAGLKTADVTKALNMMTEYFKKTF